MASLMWAAPGTPAVIGLSVYRPLLLLLHHVAVPAGWGAGRQAGIEESPFPYPFHLPPADFASESQAQATNRNQKGEGCAGQIIVTPGRGCWSNSVTWPKGNGH